MAEIASVIAVVVSLAALWLANSAQRQADSSFKDFTQHLVKKVKDAQVEFQQTVKNAHQDLNTARRSVDNLERYTQETTTKVNTLEQRLSVIEHELKSLTAALPPQYREVLSEKRNSGKKSA